MRSSPDPSGGSDETYPGVRLGEALATIQDQERQRVVRIVTMPCQQSPTLFTLHGKQLKWRFARMLLEPACSATTEVAEPIEYDYPIFRFHVVSLRHFTRVHTRD